MQQESKIGSTKRQHSDRVKAESLALLDANGGQYHKTARMLEIPLCESGVEIKYDESTTYRRQQRNISKAVFVSSLFSIPEIFNS